MSFQWAGAGRAAEIVEFHDLRTECGRRNDMLALAESTSAGSLGMFRVADEPDRLVWLKGFADMTERRALLGATYAAPQWQANRRRAADLLREESVHLVRSLNPGAGLRMASPRPLVALISELRFQEQIGSYHLWLRLFLRKAGMDPMASFATLETENDLPAVPVRRHRSEHIALLRLTGLVPELPQELRAMLRFPPEALVLEPVAGVGPH